MDFQQVIAENNKTHVVDEHELKDLIAQSKEVYAKHFSSAVSFERSVFINWTCAIADCKYCYLSTRPKLDRKAIRSKESILAEILVCKAMGWNIGYITGGLRVESTQYLTELLDDIATVLGEKTMMNFGPYHEHEIMKLKDHISGMGSAIESFDEELHSYICPSKPLKSLLRTLEILKREDMTKMITIILGMGEKKDDVFTVIENIKKYDINVLQLCFLKAQEDTIFCDTPPPNPSYMAWWIAQVRIHCPTIQIKVALVKERIADLSLYLEAGCNDFTRFMVFSDFGSSFAKELEAACNRAGRDLQGSFSKMPKISINVESLPFSLERKKTIAEKVDQYLQRLRKLERL